MGKNTLIDGLFRMRDDLHYLPSFTTREMRLSESEGNPYKFVSKSEFQKMINNNEFIEWNIVQDENYYGVNKKLIREKLDKKQSVITDIDVLGAIDIIEFFPKETVSIFVTLSNREDLEKRVKKRKRGENDEEIKKRLNRAKMEFSFKRHFDYIIVNDVVNDAINELSTVIDFEIGNIKTKKIYEKSDYLHYYINFMLVSGHKILMRQKKGEPDAKKWFLPGKHILRNETPNKALTRLLKRTIYDFNLKYPGILEWSKFAIPVSFRHCIKCETHWHYEMNFRYSVEKTEILDAPNHKYEWKDISHLDVNYL